MTGLKIVNGIWKVTIGLFLLLLVAAQGTAWAQGEASISGIITDSTGATIAGATVKSTKSTDGRNSHARHRRPLGGTTLPCWPSENIR